MTGARRLHVYLFTDLVGSTALKRRLGDVEGAATIAKHDHLFRECLKRYGGTEQNSPGDGFFATFGLPSAALHCALDFQRGLSDLALESRVGIHMGESVHVPTAEGQEAPDKLLGLGERLSHDHKMEVRLRLWKLTKDKTHLEEAHRLLAFALEHAPEDCRETMLENVPLHRDIMKAWAEHGGESAKPAQRDA